MRAAVRHEYGPPEVLGVEEVPTPAPRDDEVLIRVRAASVNLGDWELLTGEPRYIRVLAGMFAPRPRIRVAPREGGGRRSGPKYGILGSDVAGTVEAVGGTVTRYRPGDEVFGDCGVAGFGAFAEYVCVPEKSALAPKPATMSFEQAAAIPQASFIALKAFRNLVRIRPGMKVLINGAGGGAGTFGVQIAKHDGAEVTGVDGPGKLGMIRSLGADHVLDYTRESFTESDERYDAILDLAAHRSIFECRRSLAPGGIYMVAGGSWTATWQSALLGPLVSIGGKRKAVLLLADWTRDDLLVMAELFEAGKVAPVIDTCFPLEQTGEALRRVGEKRSLGKVIVNP